MKNLLGRLMSRPFEELRSIADTWGTLTRDPNPTHNDLAIASYHTLVEKPSVRGVWSSLDSEAHRFINWLLAQRNMMAILDDVPGHLSLDPEVAFPLVERMRRIGLVDVDEVLVRGSRVVSSGDNLYSWAPKSQVEAVRRRVVSISAEEAKVLREVIEESKHPAPVDEPFSTLLGSLEPEEILRIASTWKLPEAHRYYKQELIGVMSEFVATGRSRDTLLDPLSQPSRSLFSFLAENGGHSTSLETKRNFRWEERDLRVALLPLVNRALVWDVLSGDTRVLFIPRDLLSGGASQLPSNLPQPKMSAPVPYAAESHLSYEMPWDLLTILSMAEQQVLSLTLQEGRITKRVAKRINEALIHPGDLKAGSDYIDALIHLAGAVGLLAPNGEEHPALHPTPRAQEWAKLSFDAQRQRLYGFWQEDRKWAEPAAYGTIYWWNSDLTGARKRLAEHLARLPAGEWISLDSFLRRINTVDPFIIWSQEELVRRFGLRVLQGFRNQWFDIEGRILADMLKTMLLWLGIAEVGRDKQKRFLSFRLTESAANLLQPADPDKQSALRAPHSTLEKSLLVQPNFEVLVIHPESRPIWGLLKMTELVRHDRVSVYALNKASVMRAIEGGLSPDDITGLLKRYADKGLPQNVEQSIHDWARLIKRVELRVTTLLEVDDASVLDELAAARKTKKLIARRLSPTAALITLPEAADNGHEEPMSRLMRELRSAGYFPRLLEENATPTKLTEAKPTRRRSTTTIGKSPTPQQDETPTEAPRKTG